MLKRWLCGSVVVALFVVLCQFLGVFSSQVFADSGPPSQFANLPGFNNLESDLSQWNIYHDQGYTKGSIQDATIQGDGSMKVTLYHGSQNYADIHAYRNLPAADDATLFRMDVSFLFRHDKPVQALEFTMNKWVNNVRWEWALQWQVVPDGTASQGAPETWRVWTGSSWQSLNVQQELSINKWHTLHLYGTIVNNQVHYISFSCDDLVTDMSQLTFDAVASSGDKLAAGVQLDGNYREASYPVFYKDINLHYA